MLVGRPALHPCAVGVRLIGISASIEQPRPYCLQTGAPPTIDELRSYLRAHLSPQKTPTKWYAVDSYPLTGSGKIQKFAIREAWEKGEHDGHELNR